MGFLSNREEVKPAYGLHYDAKVTPFRLGLSNMDSVCSKMSESIILSNHTIVDPS